jgi:hypothetical protein
MLRSFAIQPALQHAIVVQQSQPARRSENDLMRPTRDLSVGAGHKFLQQAPLLARRISQAGEDQETRLTQVKADPVGRQQPTQLSDEVSLLAGGALVLKHLAHLCTAEQKLLTFHYKVA